MTQSDPPLGSPVGGRVPQCSGADTASSRPRARHCWQTRGEPQSSRITRSGRSVVPSGARSPPSRCTPSSSWSQGERKPSLTLHPVFCVKGFFTVSLAEDVPTPVSRASASRRGAGHPLGSPCALRCRAFLFHCATLARASRMWHLFLCVGLLLIGHAPAGSILRATRMRRRLRSSGSNLTTSISLPGRTTQGRDRPPAR